MTVHSRYDPCRRGGDIAILEISPNMFSEGSPICMPKFYEATPRQLMSAGFGSNPDHPGKGYLQAVNLTFKRISPYDEIETYTVDRIPCAGDSGGPLFAVIDGKYTLLGIAARSVACLKNNKGWYVLKIRNALVHQHY
ncbi:hypothetical protein DICVIV_13953 [Dictyocaulus viviparus]|uniref:Peptidase S1 domain-containing protein n=1 Tax=Dictyocaulus viviparus TaxID=29172 RepID=A0A0D8X906_DICVI|nr:hypothetical protein DICVIV_13953 [Dictyocaulus viviparus]